MVTQDFTEIWFVSVVSVATRYSMGGQIKSRMNSVAPEVKATPFLPMSSTHNFRDKIVVTVSVVI